MHDHLITADPDGRPIVAGTNITVAEILRELAACEQVIDVIVKAHPELDRAKARAALEFAAEVVHGTASVSHVQSATESQG